jgi:hypothetical protein
MGFGRRAAGALGLAATADIADAAEKPGAPS